MMATVIKFLTPLLPQMVRYPHEGTTLSHAIGQISALFHRHHQPQTPGNHHKFGFYIVSDKVAQTVTRQIFRFLLSTDLLHLTFSLHPT